MAGTPAGPTPGPTPASSSLFNLSPEHGITVGSGREGSAFSSSRRSTLKRSGRQQEGVDGEAEGAQGEAASDMDDDEDDDDEADNELDLLLGDDEYDEQAKERSEAKEALRCDTLFMYAGSAV